jgi:hypothetical protein
MFCEQCGAKIGDGARFCEGCGTAAVTEPAKPFQVPTIQGSSSPSRVRPEQPSRIVVTQTKSVGIAILFTVLFGSILFILMISSCSTKPSEGKIKAVIEEGHQNLVKVVSLSKGEEEKPRISIYRTDFMAEVEWLDTVTVRRSSDLLTRKSTILIERGEKKSSGGGGFVEGLRDATLGKPVFHRRGDREKIGGRINCKKTWMNWECILFSDKWGLIEFGQNVDSMLRSGK